MVTSYISSFDMKKLAIKIFAYIFSISLLWICYVCAIDHVCESIYGINTAKQIKKGFENATKGDYSILFLGSSSIYRDINPDVITSSKAYNFAHDNDAPNQYYYKLKYLLDRNVQIDTLILGIDYTSFAYISDTRNYIYDRYFGSDYIKDYNSLIGECVSNIKMYFITKQKLFPQFVEYLEGAHSHNNYLKENGQYIKNGTASPDDKVDRDEIILPFQINYFKAIVDLCKSRGIHLFVINCPTRDEELQAYSKEFIIDFDNQIIDILGDTCKYKNYSTLSLFKDYRQYVDICHLNEQAATEFTKYMWDDLTKQ